MLFYIVCLCMYVCMPCVCLILCKSCLYHLANLPPDKVFQFGRPVAGHLTCLAMHTHLHCRALTLKPQVSSVKLYRTESYNHPISSYNNFQCGCLFVNCMSYHPTNCLVHCCIVLLLLFFVCLLHCICTGSIKICKTTIYGLVEANHL